MAGGTSVMMVPRFAVGDLVRVSGKRCDPCGPHEIEPLRPEGTYTAFDLTLLPMHKPWATEEQMRLLNGVLIPHSMHSRVLWHLGHNFMPRAIVACASISAIGCLSGLSPAAGGIKLTFTPSEAACQATDRAFEALVALDTRQSERDIAIAAAAFRISAGRLTQDFPITAGYQSLIQGMLLLWQWVLALDRLNREETTARDEGRDFQIDAQLVLGPIYEEARNVLLSVAHLFTAFESRADDLMVYLASEMLRKVADPNRPDIRGR